MSCELLHLANDDGWRTSKSAVVLLKGRSSPWVVVWGGVGKSVNNVEFIHNRADAARRGVVFFEVADRGGSINGQETCQEITAMPSARSSASVGND